MTLVGDRSPMVVRRQAGEGSRSCGMVGTTTSTDGQ